MEHTHDVIIIGQGLAGVVLSELLADVGKRVMIFDAPLEGRASEVATGMVNPIVLRRTVPSWRASEMLAIAGAFYRELELDYETTFWHPMPLVELFPTAQEAGLWHLRMKEGENARMLGIGPAEDPAVAQLPQPYGSGIIKRCAWLNVQLLLRLHRERWIKAGELTERKVAREDLRMTTDGVEIDGCKAPVVVWCAGAFHEVPGFVAVRGEGLTVHIPGLSLRSMVHRGTFVVPVGEETYRVGATFAWEDVWSGPTKQAREHLLDKVARIWNGEVRVLDHWAGVRPAAKDRRPILGRTSAHEAVLTGFGSRGVLLAPWCATHLMAHLLQGEPLDPEVDIARFV